MNPFMRRRLAGLLLLTALPAARAVAQQPARLTMADAIRRGLHADPSLALAAAASERARSNVREAGAARLPTFSLDGNATQFEEPMLVAPLHRVDPTRPIRFDNTLMQGSATLAYTLFDASRGARIDRAQALEASARIGERATHMQLLADISRLYLRLRSARELTAASASRVSALERERNRATQLVEQGKAARVVLLRAQAALSTAQAESVSANTNEEVATNDLARQLVVSADSLRATILQDVEPATAALLDADSLRAQAEAHNPDLARAGRQLTAAELGRIEARGSRLPRLLLGGKLIEYASADNAPQGEWQGGLQLSYSVFTGGARAAAIDRASAEVSAARAEYELRRRQVDDAVDRAVAAVKAARARISALAAGVTQSEEVTRIERLALDAGAGVQTDYLRAEADLFSARAALTDARASELIALIELARVTGQLSEQWLAEHVESYQ